MSQRSIALDDLDKEINDLLDDDNWKHLLAAESNDTNNMNDDEEEEEEEEDEGEDDETEGTNNSVLIANSTPSKSLLDMGTNNKPLVHQQHHEEQDHNNNINNTSNIEEEELDDDDDEFPDYDNELTHQSGGPQSPIEGLNVNEKLSPERKENPYRNSRTKTLLEVGNLEITFGQAKLFGLVDAQGNLNLDKLNKHGIPTKAQRKHTDHLARPLRTVDDLTTLELEPGLFKPKKSDMAMKAMRNPRCGYDFVNRLNDRGDPLESLTSGTSSGVKKDLEAEKDMYDYKQDKLSCPVCKRTQSFDEYIEKRRFCGLCKEKYTKLNVVDVFSFDKKLKLKMSKKEENLARIEDEMYGYQKRPFQAKPVKKALLRVAVQTTRGIQGDAKLLVSEQEEKKVTADRGEKQTRPSTVPSTFKATTSRFIPAATTAESKDDRLARTALSQSKPQQQQQHTNPSIARTMPAASRMLASRPPPPPVYTSAASSAHSTEESDMHVAEAKASRRMSAQYQASKASDSAVVTGLGGDVSKKTVKRKKERAVDKFRSLVDY